MKRLRTNLMARGQMLATLLSQVMAGKEPSLDLVPGKPGLRPEERLRAALDAVEKRRMLIDADDDAYGCCDICHVDLGLAQLDEMPWADRCPAHADA